MLRYYPDPILRQVADPLPEDEGPELFDKLKEELLEQGGLGLAAPQIGVSSRAFVINLAKLDDLESEEPDIQMFINPEIVSKSTETHSFAEGCLSVPGMVTNVSRATTVTLRYVDLEGRLIERDFKGYDASCVQHEMDHLNGVMFFDHLASLEKRLFLKKYKKFERKLRKIL